MALAGPPQEASSSSRRISVPLIECAAFRNRDQPCDRRREEFPEVVALLCEVAPSPFQKWAELVAVGERQEHDHLSPGIGRVLDGLHLGAPVAADGLLPLTNP